MSRPKIYTASKLTHAEKWLALSFEWHDIEFTARWPLDYITTRHPNVMDPKAGSRFWVEDEFDVRDADFVLVYAEHDDVLRGACVEAGIGIALGKRVIVVGECNSYSSWQHHPLCMKVPTLGAARRLILEYGDSEESMATTDYRKEVKGKIPHLQAVRAMKNFILDLDTNGYLDVERGVVESTFLPGEFLEMCDAIGVQVDLRDCGEESQTVAA